MKLSLILAFLWVLVSAITAMMPMRKQRYLGLPLLVAAPILLFFLGRDFGVWIVLIALAAFASMFRYPLIYIYKRLRGLPVELPPELRNPKK